MLRRASLFASGIVLTVATLAGAQPKVGIGYAAVTSKDVGAARFLYYFDADRKHHSADFSWTFAEKTLTIRAGSGPIPKELLADLLPDGGRTQQIDAEWSVEKNPRGGTDLVLKNITAEGKPGRASATFPVYRTSPTVLRIGARQYTFGLLP